MEDKKQVSSSSIGLNEPGKFNKYHETCGIYLIFMCTRLVFLADSRELSICINRNAKITKILVRDFGY